MSTLNILVAQMNTLVGDFDGNTQRVIEIVKRAGQGEAIIASGMDREQVQRVQRLVDINEYKQRRAPIGVRITSRGFGRDRRYAITSGWRIGE